MNLSAIIRNWISYPEHYTVDLATGEGSFSRTYVMGSQGVLWYDPDIIERLKSIASPWWKMFWRYRSNWRILHIDGIEGCDPDGKQRATLPRNLGKKTDFFHYKISEGTCSTEKQPSKLS